MVDNIIFIIDSCISVKEYIESYTKMINSILDKQRQINPNTVVTCIFFDDTINYKYINCPIYDIKIEDISLKEGRSIFDNVCVIINFMLKMYKVNKQNPPVVIILTNGEDQTSSRLELKHLNLQVGLAKTKDWKFIFMGNDLNSVKIGKYSGCNVCVNYDHSEKCLENISELYCEIEKYKIYNENNIDFDIRDVTSCLSEMKIV